MNPLQRAFAEAQILDPRPRGKAFEGVLRQML